MRFKSMEEVRKTTSNLINKNFFQRKYLHKISLVFSLVNRDNIVQGMK